MFFRKETIEPGQNSYYCTFNSATSVVATLSFILFIQTIDNLRFMPQLNEKKGYFSITRFKSTHKNSLNPQMEKWNKYPKGLT